ncbi:hypothetical protein QE152_g36252 [Popillia japonica]|uniref:Uncharacterized protein n=1 Tax=Popillia japonica TaxID=7064 RepID=A0AAW1ICQ6_POPJA
MGKKKWLSLWISYWKNSIYVIHTSKEKITNFNSRNSRKYNIYPNFYATAWNQMAYVPVNIHFKCGEDSIATVRWRKTKSEKRIPPASSYSLLSYNSESENNPNRAHTEPAHIR